MLELPPLVEEVARRLHLEGCIYAEAYPLRKWQKEGWPQDDWFYRMVDGVLKILRAMDEKK
jgi:hypothetical protein